MKKTAIILLACGLLLFGAAQGAEAASYTVTFTENLTTGYAWYYAVSDEAVLSVEDLGYAAAADADQMIGAGGLHSWAVSGLKAGEASVTFSYSWLGESLPGDATAAYTFASDVAGNLTLLSTDGLPEQYMPNMAVVRLRENPTTGYQWELSADPAGILTPVSDAYAADPAAEGLMGAGGVHSWVFGAQAQGTAVLTFLYRRASDSADQADATVKFTYIVDSDLHAALMGIDGDYEAYIP